MSQSSSEEMSPPDPAAVASAAMPAHMSQHASGRVSVPIFGGDKSYDRWKEEIKAWQLTTPTDKSKQALFIALALPEGSEVRRRIFEESGPIEDLNQESGVDILITRLDKWYKKDNLSAAYDAWTKFDGCKKTGDISMEEYISEFRRRNNELKKFKVSIPNCILAFKMLDNASLDLKEKQIALTAVAFDDDAKILDLMEQSLVKFFGSQELFATGVSSSPAVEVKSEPILSTEEVNVTQRTRGRGGYYRGRYRRNFDQGRGESAESNHKNSYGRKCFLCGSEYHLAQKCPKNVLLSESKEDTKENESLICCDFDINEVYKVEKCNELVRESFDYAILDTACSSTVCGEEWLSIFMDGLSHDKKTAVHEEKSDSCFKFGDGRTYKSLKRVTLPVHLAGKDERISTDVVECCIPLLLSKKSMKKGKMKLDMENDLIRIKGREIKLDCTGSGHYRLPLTDHKENSKKMNQILLSLGENDGEKQKKIKKLHHQFGHPSARRLKILMKDAGIEDSRSHNMVDDVTNGCETCVRYKRTPSRPVVSMNMANDMNDIVALDLKEFKKGKIYFLHMVDLATRFSRSCITRSKEPKEIVEAIITTWLGSGLGAPKKFLCDNGGEFANNIFLDLCENMNIEVMHSAAYSPFSNGVCERNHAVVDDMVYKLMAEQPNLPLHVALAWAVNAKNCLQMVGGFSPYQLVYGRNPNLPCVTKDELPALEGSTASEVIARHLNACHSARKAFIEAESSEKVRRALKAAVKQTRKHFESGDKVYFKRPERKEWSGPATVIGMDGKTIILKYGANIIRAHETHVQEIPCSYQNAVEEEKHKLLETVRETFKPKINSGEGEKMSDVEDEDEAPQMTGELNPINDSTAIITRPIPNIGEKVRYLTRTDDNWSIGTIHSRAGKATGQYKDWRNVQDEDGKIKAMDWMTDVEKWEKVIEENRTNEEIVNDGVTKMGETDDLAEANSSNEILMASSKLDDERIDSAKQKELESWKQFGVYTEVNDDGQSAISVRWVITEKADKRVKARLVARGFEEKEDIKSDSPTVSKEVLRSFMAICSSKNWDVNSIDIKAAFLQSEGIGRDVYLVPPVEAKCHKSVLWKLEKCVYGLNDAARNWYLTVKTFLLKMNCVQLKTDPAAFYWHQNGEVAGIFLSYACR